jgi:uncharacterized protein (DUF952 family)
MFIYHITSEIEWLAAKQSSAYRPSRFAIDGFIHCSYKDQVIRTANKLFLHQNGLILLKIDEDLVPGQILEENLEGGEELFPHIYGALPVSAVIASAPLICSDSGFTFPANL